MLLDEGYLLSGFCPGLWELALRLASVSLKGVVQLPEHRHRPLWETCRHERQVGLPSWQAVGWRGGQPCHSRKLHPQQADTTLPIHRGCDIGVGAKQRTDEPCHDGPDARTPQGTTS